MDGNGKFERVSGTSLGGGTFWGLGRLLTKCNRYFLIHLVVEIVVVLADGST